MSMHRYKDIKNYTLLVELSNTYKFRMEEAPSRVSNHMVFREGWAMYTEWLGFYLGLYQKDLHQQFGFYAFGKSHMPNR